MNGDLIIRKEEPKDYAYLRALLNSAFASDPSQSSSEYVLVEHLRQSPHFIDELALVAELNGQVVGYILLSEVLIKNENESFVSLALAPMAVLPDHQGRGIGSELIRQAHIKALRLGYRSIVLIGHEKYYPRFGYKRARDFNISFPFDVPDPNAMVLELQRGALKDIRGKVVYPDAFHLL